MKKLVFSLLTVVMPMTMFASELPYWQDPNVIEVNRYPMTATFDTQGNRLSLNGLWDFKWYETLEKRSADFYKTNFVLSDWDKMLGRPGIGIILRLYLCSVIMPDNIVGFLHWMIHGWARMCFCILAQLPRM